MLTALQDARSPRNLDLPGWRLHHLKGDRRGQWSVRVSGNWRIVFRFADGEAVNVDLIDYHRGGCNTRFPVFFVLGAWENGQTD